MHSASASLFCFCCKDTTSPKINHTFLYVSCDSRIFYQISYKIILLYTKHTSSVRQTETVVPRHSTTDVRIGRGKPKSHIWAHRFLLVGTFRLHVSLPFHELLELHFIMLSRETHHRFNISLQLAFSACRTCRKCIFLLPASPNPPAQPLPEL